MACSSHKILDLLTRPIAKSSAKQVSKRESAMSQVKRYLEQVSVDLGFEGEITDDVVEVAQDGPREPLLFQVRTGLGTVNSAGEFSDVVEEVARIPVVHENSTISSWRSVRYKGKRYQLLGGVRTPYFISLNNPLGS